MRENLIKTIKLLLLAWFIPIVLSQIIYYGFATNYTTNVFSEIGFKNQYENGIYKYRVLGRMIFLKINDFIDSYGFSPISVRSLNLLDPLGTNEYYATYFINNTLFLCLTVTILFLIIDRKCSLDMVLLKDFSLLLMTLLIVITQYVVVPYDTLSYFLIALAIYFVLSKQSLLNLLILCLIVFLATITRETAALVLSFYFAVYHRELLKLSKPFNKYQIYLGVLIICFVITYFSLRFIFGFEYALYQSIQILNNLSFSALTGLLFFGAISLILLLDEHGRKQCVLFLAASLPYIVLLVFVANLWEIRLWIPIIIALIILKLHSVPPVGISKREFISPTS